LFEDDVPVFPGLRVSTVLQAGQRRSTGFSFGISLSGILYVFLQPGHVMEINLALLFVFLYAMILFHSLKGHAGLQVFF
jgi:hypothetical protein